MANEDHLAYGDYHQEDEPQERGIIGDTFRKLRGNQSDRMFPSILGKVHRKVHEFGTEVAGKIGGEETHSHTHIDANCTDGSHDSPHRYASFAAERDRNDVKWYVDGCGYMWAVSVAIEQARESIWILDWWLSPELYLRRPPSRNEQYRIDRMLQAAAQRGVKVNIIVYKEVSQALTLHTKHALEALHPNISVFRHPDHLPDAQSLQSSFMSSLQNLSLTAATASKLPADALKAIYGMNEDVILYWAHHEKLCLVDGEITFMGGLDLCYGRWDTNSHPIADAHPGNLDDIVFPGQDFNNARIMDFNDVSNWENNKLDRTQSSRMGWSDISISLRGPVVEDLQAHFVERWNFIYNEKYDVRKDSRYSRLTIRQSTEGMSLLQQSQPDNSSFYGNQSTAYDHSQTSPPYSSYQSGSAEQMYFPPPPVTGRGAQGQYMNSNARGAFDESEDPIQSRLHRKHQFERDTAARIMNRVENKFHRVENQLFDETNAFDGSGAPHAAAGVSCQLLRSCTKWSHGIATEHSIANAYIEIINNSQHFVYIENQFFITATCNDQKPVVNKIGAALVGRILRAARAGEKYKVIVLMPAVPAFAGDLKDESSLGTRAIMEFQYNSINRGGHSIMESVAAEGFNPTEYIRFYNLRNYDRLNVSASMREAEQASGVDYEHARREHDDMVDPAGYHAQQGAGSSGEPTAAEGYQRAAQAIAPRRGLGSGRWDSVSECYMLGGRDIREVPWENGNVAEIDAFVSEELYIHSKVLIADDRTVICGSANLNDRSQLGYHDSEIAVVIEDSATLDSRMNGQPFRASKFAATLRRQLFRKHLGLIPPQNMEQAEQNSLPVGVPNMYDFGSAEDEVVMDPLSDRLWNFWNGRARQNTDAFGRIFHPVPHDSVRNWKDYDIFYGSYFHESGPEAGDKGGVKKAAKYRWGHVVAENFAPGEQGLREMKDLLTTIKGTVVEMPLLFLIEEDIAKEGLGLNAFTEEIYT
ncbi:hypothetical protein MMC30_006233 [Trapelia coarctata]|nr:hypothetical protein [Trapelia coarctata]